MNRPLILAPVLSLAVLMGVPTAALAQTFPSSAAVVASVHALGDTRALARNERTTAATWRAPTTEAASLRTHRPATLKLPQLVALEDRDAPQVDIRAKDEWYDDQGLRASVNKVSFKRRF